MEKDYKDKEIEELRRDLRLMKLRRQVTPHFLFNSLSVAVSLVITSPKEAVAFLRRIAEMYRYLLNYGDEYAVPIEKELVMMRQYFDLMSTRHVDCLELHVSRAVRQLRGYPLPPLSLQGLVENAIRHNAHTPEKKLKINLLTDGDWLIVSNNRLPLLSDGGSTRMGLTYMDETMLLLFTSRWRATTGISPSACRSSRPARPHSPIRSAHEHPDF